MKPIYAVIFCFALSSAFGEIIPAGAGSYTTARPTTCAALPTAIFKSPALRGPTVTGQWWSSLLWQKYSNNLFPHPLGVVCTSGGLAVSYPGAAIVAADNAIMGGAVTADGDFRIGHSAVADFPAAVCAGYSDWFVTAEFALAGASLRTSFGHGSPYVYCIYQGGGPLLSFSEIPRIWSGGMKDAVLGVTVRGNHYGLFGAAGSSWKSDGKTLANISAKPYFSIALLPDANPETLAKFKQHAYNHVTGTRQDYHLDGGTMRTSYHFDFKTWEGSENGTLFALYPHQWKYATTKLTQLHYASVRGRMIVGEGDGFETVTPIQGILPTLPPQGIRDRGLLLRDLQDEADRTPPEFADTYWEGKYLGRLASLSGIADAADAPELRQRFTNEIKRRLENWFTASPAEISPLFYYNKKWGALIGSKPSYGSDKSLNDHHFHYGYFIRAAAEIARHDPAWAEKWGPMVKLLIRDIASPDRDDALFPHIRCFDKYAGHSWASGDADFADGNNQESSSESMNAWYGMALWGAATGDDVIRDTGIFLYNTERTAVEEYWFDVSGTNFPKEFPQVALGMIWGGKGAFATWFSGDIDCIHGINWLPFTPASLSMGRHPDYVKTNYDRIVAKRPGGTGFNTGWGDLVVMFGALENPGRAAAYLDAHPQCKLEGGNTHAFMDHWIGTLVRLGTVDSSVSADLPFSQTFTKNGRKTHVAYNFSAAPVTVRFSDGAHLQVPAGKMAADFAGE